MAHHYTRISDVGRSHASSQDLLSTGQAESAIFLAATNPMACDSACCSDFSGFDQQLIFIMKSSLARLFVKAAGSRQKADLSGKLGLQGSLGCYRCQM